MALLFDGTNDSVDHGEFNALDTPSSVTWSFWHLPVVSATNDAWVSKRTGANGFVIGTAGVATTARLITGNSANNGSLALSVTNGVWRHWGWIYDGAGATNADRLKLVLDGVQRTLTFSGVISAGNIIDTVAHLLAGQEVGVNFPNMRLAHLRIWASEDSAAALTVEQVRAEMNSYRPVRTRNLHLWAPYDDGTAARDYSGRGNNGTATVSGQIAGPPISYGGST